MLDDKDEFYVPQPDWICIHQDETGGVINGWDSPTCWSCGIDRYARDLNLGPMRVGR